MTFKAYLLKLVNGVPHEVYIILLVVFCLGVVLLIGVKGWRKGLRYSMGIILAEYVFLLYGSTVIFRKAAKVRSYDYTPFWSYSKPELMQENIMNAVVFVPVGILLGCAFKSMTWWKVVIIGMCVSGMIETMQFIYKRGFAEVDDVMHNTLGCVIGFGIYKMVASVRKALSSKRRISGL